MIGKIIDAITKECQAIPDFQVGTIMRKTDFSLKDIGSYDMPMILIDFIDASESGQLLGGATRMDYLIGLNAYGFLIDNLGDDTTGYPTDLQNVIDVTRLHFSKGNNANFLRYTDALISGKTYMVLGGVIAYNGQSLPPGTSFAAVDGTVNFSTTAGGYVVNGGWLTYGMWQLLNYYGFRFTLSGLHAADALEGDGLINGYRVQFDTISFDTDTCNMAPSTEVLTYVNQVANPPYDMV